LLVLGPIVLLHELGHFVFAKRAGIRVLEFGWGLPPLARKLWRGMGKLRLASTTVHTPRNFKYPAGLADGAHVNAEALQDKKGRWVLTSIALIDTGDPRAVTTPEALQQGERLCLRGEVSDFDPGTEYTLNWLPMGGFVRMLGEEDPSAPRSFAAAPKRWRTAVLLGGPGVNIVMALVLFVAAYMLGQLFAETYTVKIAEVVSGSPADQAGLTPGMRVLSVAGIPVESSQELVDYTAQHLGENISVAVMDENGARRELEVYARRVDERPQNEGAMGVTISMRPLTYSIQYRSFSEALRLSVEDVGLFVKNLIGLPGLLLSGQIEPSQARPVGPAGIAQLASFALESSIEQGVLFPLLRMAGIISLALGLTNLLPLPALDGGRLVFVLLEALRGKRIAPEKEAMVHFAGFMLLLALLVMITIQDFASPLNNPF
jgi:regulator of sigma E protease